MKFFLFFLLVLNYLPAHSDAGLQSRMQEAQGKTFEALGPNCFATAMKISGVTSTYRGMDDKEFAIIKKNFCQQVTEPQPGDIGVFEIRGFGFIHAYVYVSPGWGMQKPGVDYNGKTPISLQSLESINYSYLASAECRRFSKDISECSNLHYYIRCQDFFPMLISYNAALEAEVKEIETRMSELLEQGSWTQEQKQLTLHLHQHVQDLRHRLNHFINDAPAVVRDYVLARQTSLEKQTQFLLQKIN